MPELPDENMPDKKIIVDEDWKSQVAAERQGAKSTQSEGENIAVPAEVEEKVAQGAAQQNASAPQPAKASDRAEPQYQLPPASLTFLVTTLGTQAMVSLGEIPNPVTGQAERHLPQAKHFIDTLAMLEEKTNGNRTPEESSLLRGLLHQLRMAFVVGQND
ncbi:MAG: DUF1844 domain-containing protein [Planctomycetota bacterium]|nr:DUF1844 domain-containing protein [Planctomycetota bacterium]